MQINKTFIALLLIVFLGVSCSAGSKVNGKNCGCAAKKGMSGY
jgi:hypothetical protein